MHLGKFLGGLCAAFILSAVSFGQTVNWRASFGLSPADEALAVRYGLDGRVYACGHASGSSANLEFFVVALTAEGSTLWTYSYLPPGAGSAKANDLVVEGGNVYVTGYVADINNPLLADAVVVSLNAATGAQNWIFTYNGPANLADIGDVIEFGEDGNIYVGGLTNLSSTLQQVFTVFSLDSTGQLRWIYTTGAAPYLANGAVSVIYAGGNIYAAGTSGYTKFTVVSLTTAGAERWIYTAGSLYANAYSVIYGGDGNIYAVGWVDFDFAVVSLNRNDGSVRWYWDEPYGYATDIVYGNDANLYVSGMNSNQGGNGDFTVVSLTTAGVKRWGTYLNAPQNMGDRALSVAYGRDGGVYACGTYETYIFLGIPRTDFVVAKFSPVDGVKQWEYQEGQLVTDEIADAVVRGQYGEIYVCGVTAEGSPTFLDFSVLEIGT